ncbi:PEPxxWA-CTERM sorting domain-containing protein [Sphingomonas sp. MG17]|uniref:PEPxxWA-CTERM sorting domain-containing protein n=1 Tax=Sphingomonas tagetis TaxID=2949092 RepID=A0A9X2HTH2_9SPHN|nr:PEPxxWA-CTERM sorting domain-containing protein [Sphingomonas tagetis]MCP3733219.1 PEPxxWA-CTERM sorting domain-containing protein [Sphingomonas tagetis]
MAPSTRVGVAFAILISAQAASAQNRTFTASGQITSIYDSALVPQMGSVAPGDAFRLTINFDPLLAVGTGNVGQYRVPYTYNAQVGGFSFFGQAGIAGNYFQAMNDFNACGPNGPPSCVVDAAYFSSVGFEQTNGPFPINPGPGTIYRYFDVQFFDGTATALSSSSLSALDELSNFSSVNLTFGIFNATQARGIYVNAANAGFSFASAVPEPATWLMMIGGFGMIGGSMRYRRRVTRLCLSPEN